MEIYDALKQCKNGRATGPGGIPIELIIYGPDTLIAKSQIIFNKYLIQEEKVPKA